MGPAFGRRCIPSRGVAPSSNTPGMLGRRAWPDGRLAALGASPPFMRWVLIYRSVMAFTTLISPAALGMPLGDPAFAVVDCSFRLDDESWGEREYMNLHIPGAEYAHLGRDLSGPITGTNGRHPLPDPKTFANTLSKFGITSGMQVVAYDQDNGVYASRLWWML